MMTIISRTVPAAMLGALLLAQTIALVPAWAAQTVKNLKQPIPVSLDSTLATDTAKEGDAFQGILKESLVYQEQSIPSGTVFKGHVAKVRDSKRFARAGYLDLQVDEAVFPSGETYRFDKEKVEKESKRYHHEKAFTVKTIVTRGGPMTAASVGASVPLVAATTLPGGVIYAITTGVRTVAAAGLEIPRRHEHPDGWHYAGYSAGWGTGALPAYKFVSKSPSAKLEEGQIVNLYLEPEMVQGLFQANKDLKQLNTTLVEPKSTVSN